MALNCLLCSFLYYSYEYEIKHSSHFCVLKECLMENEKESSDVSQSAHVLNQRSPTSCICASLIFEVQDITRFLVRKNVILGAVVRLE